MDKVEMHCKDAVLINSEYKNSIRLILHGTELGLFKLDKKYTDDERRNKLLFLIEDINGIIKDYKEVWVKRNRLGGLDESLKKLNELKDQYIEALNV